MAARNPSTLPRVIRRHPQVALIDGLAYENPPGSPNAHRWQDVEQLLDAGISVITSVNLQYLEKLQDEVERITGKRASCTIPRGFLDRSADEIVVVDAPAIGKPFAAGSPRRIAPTLLAEEHKLSRLRELALLVAASVVDRQLESYLRSHGVDQSWGVQERILVCVTPRSNAASMLESGRRNADRFQGEFYVVYVQQPVLSHEDRAILQQNLDYARATRRSGGNLQRARRRRRHFEVRAAERDHADFCRPQHARREAWRRLWGNLVERLIRSAEGIDVVVYPQ